MTRGFWIAAAALLLAGAALLGVWTARVPQAQLMALPRSEMQARVEPIVRDYLVSNPQVIVEAMERLQRQQMEAAVTTLGPELEKPFAGAVMGNPDGDVTIVEFSDYRCPYCKRSHAMLMELLAEDPGLRVVVREVPILDRPGEQLSRRAAEAALAAARQGRYAAFRDALFTLPGRLRQEDIVATVRRLGLNERKLVADMASGEISAEIARSLTLAQNMGLSGTPTYVIGGQILPGVVDPSAFQAAIAAARKAG